MRGWLKVIIAIGVNTIATLARRPPVTALSGDFCGGPVPLFLPLSCICEPIRSHISLVRPEAAFFVLFCFSYQIKWLQVAPNVSSELFKLLGETRGSSWMEGQGMGMSISCREVINLAQTPRCWHFACRLQVAEVVFTVLQLQYLLCCSTNLQSNLPLCPHC